MNTIYTWLKAAEAILETVLKILVYGIIVWFCFKAVGWMWVHL